MAKAPKRAAKPRGKGGKGGGGPKKPLPKREPARRPARSGKQYEVLCSECYSSFSFSANASASSISCPECMHVGNIGAKDVMSKIAIAKAGEQSGLMKALIPGVLFMLVGIVWTGMLASKAAVDASLGSGANYGFAGALFILLIVTIGLAFKYESNRHDVYF